MNPDPDLARLEERVREAFPPCEHHPITLPQGASIHQKPFFPEASLDCWRPYLITIPAIRLSEIHRRNRVTVHSPEQL